MRESEYQSKIIRKLKQMFPDCEILHTESASIQGIPDLIILWREYWAALEVKTSELAHVQPNQNHYVDKLSDMSFAAFIYPENEKEVLSALQEAFKPPRRARISQS